jgi:hypothetical protein
LALSGEQVQAQAAYRVLALWKDADPGIPILEQAKADAGSGRLHARDLFSDLILQLFFVESVRIPGIGR